MKEDEVNELIVNKIKNSKNDEEIRHFLISILNWEMSHDHEARPRFMEDFIKIIERCCRQK